MLACRQLVGIGDAPPGGVAVDAALPETGSAPACGLAYAGEACEACLGSQCCAEATACAGSPACAALQGCQGACQGDPTCRAQCVVQEGFGTDVATPALDACLVTRCSGPCGLLCGAVTDVLPVDAAAACQSCIVANICEPMTACAADPGCQSIVRCVFSSHTFDTQGSCFGDAGAGDAGAGDAADTDGPSYTFGNAAAAIQSCTTPCAIGSNWSCLGRFTWPVQTAPSITVTATFSDLVNSQPLVGATVKICGSADRTCTSPFASGQTDDAGVVSLEPPAHAGGWENGYFDVSSPTSVPEVVFWSAPITQPNAVLPSVGTATLTEVTNEAMAVGFTLDPTLGTVFVMGYDCNLNGAVGLQFSVSPTDPSTKLFYFGNNLLSATQDSTNRSGRAVFVNVPAQTQLVLDATPKGSSTRAGTTGFFTRPGAISWVMLPPTP